MKSCFCLGVIASLLGCFSAWAGPVPLPAKACTDLNDRAPFDLGPQKPGKFQSGKVEFLLAPNAGKSGCSGLVFGKNSLKKIRLDAAPAAGEDTVYLLHAAQKCPKNGQEIGKVTLYGKNGVLKEYPVCYGQETGWFLARSGGKNAVRVFSIYNGATQISLFAAAFPCPREVTSIELEGTDTPWCVAAVSVTQKAKLAPIYPRMRAVKKHTPVPQVSADVLAKISASENTPVRNVIFIIGDGMGFGSREFTSRYFYGKPGALQAEQLPVQTSATTFSANRKVTDSAASGTALAGGYKTNNGMVGMTPDGTKYHSIAAMAKKAGYAVGIVTNDSLVGATPSAYYGHVPRRKMSAEIVDGLAVCNFDVLIGNAGRSGFVSRKDKKDMLSLLKSQKMDVVTEISDLAKVPAEKRVLGFLKFKDPESVGEVTAFTLNRLSANPRGFFVMIECAWPDGGGHSNDPDRTLDGVLGTDAALVAALKFAAGHQGTLVIVTADHETGGIQVIPASGNAPVMVKYTTTSHTGAPVPVFAAGSGCRAFAKDMDNAKFAGIIADFLKVELKQPVK